MKFRLLWPRSAADAELGLVIDRYLKRIKHFFPIETPLKAFVSAHPNLVRHCETIHAAVAA